MKKRRRSSSPAEDDKELLDALNRIANSGHQKPSSRIDGDSASSVIHSAKHLLNSNGRHLSLSYKLCNQSGDYLSGSLSVGVDNIVEEIGILKQFFKFAMR
jgi:hypothetical protein